MGRWRKWSRCVVLTGYMDLLARLTGFCGRILRTEATSMVRPCFKLRSGMRHASTQQIPPGVSLSRNSRLQPPSGLHAHKTLSYRLLLYKNVAHRHNIGAAQALCGMLPHSAKIPPGVPERIASNSRLTPPSGLTPTHSCTHMLLFAPTLLCKGCNRDTGWRTGR